MNLNLRVETGCKRRCMPLKYLLVMKLIFLLTTIACLQVSARTAAQSISLSKTDAPLTEVFNSIKQQSNYKFFWKGDDLSKFKVTVTLKNANITETMDKVLKDLPLTYSITANTIVIQPKEIAVPNKPKEIPALPQRLLGRVVDGHNQGLPGASVVLQRTKAVTLTDQSGDFVLDNVLATDSLAVTYIGYEKKTVRVGSETRLVIEMKEANNKLDQVVVQAYGVTSQRITTGDIGKVTAADIEKQPVVNVLEALQGKVAGLDVTQTSGYGSAPFKVEIRGRSAINSSFAADPLYIIDGVPLTVLELTGNPYGYQNGSSGFLQNGFSSPAGGQSPLFSLNPSDIQSVEILKDADATAIYGSRGANGVILITTKKGKPGKMSLEGNIQEGVTHATRFWQLMNTQQYLAMRHEAFRNDGASPDPIADYDINGTWDTTRYTDWQKKLFGGWGKALNAQASVSGGNTQTTYRVGFGYDRTTDITTTSGSDQRGSLSFNLGTKSLDNKFTFDLGANYNYTRSAIVNIPAAFDLAPDAPAIYDAQGKLNYAGWAGSNNNTNASNAFPFAVLEQPYISSTNFIASHLALGYQIMKRLNFSVNVGFNNEHNTQTQLFPISSQDPSQNPTGTSDWGYNSNTNWQVEPLLKYNSAIGKGALNIVLGASEQQTNTDGIYITGSGYTNDELLHSLSSAPTTTTYQNTGEFRYNSIFGRINYNWENKYILNLNGRRDGSSRFGPGKQFGNFGSFGAAWIFTEESWLKDKLPFLSFGKLRGSYGTTGSDGVPPYQYLTQYSSANTFPYGGVSPLRPTVEANPDFHWQVNTKLEGAINLGFLHDRINIEVVYYRDRTGNQLVAYPLPTLTGFANVTANSKALVQNSGMEYNATFNVINGSKFKWSANFNLAVNHNKLLAYPNLAQSPYASLLIVGQPLNIKRLLKYNGVDPLTGYYSFYDKNHDGVITYDPNHVNDDTYPVDISPKFLGGGGMNFSYGDLSLSLFFTFKKQLGANGLIVTRNGTGGLLNTNQPIDVLNRWQQPGDIGPRAKFTQNITTNTYSDLGISDGAYTDASFIKLSNLSLSYNLPTHFVKKLGVQNVSVFINANNLLTITGYQGIDPETQIFGSIPPTRTIVGGLSFKF